MQYRRNSTKPTADRSSTGLIRAISSFVAEELERRVLLSTAIAAFGSQATFGTGSQPRSVTSADVNGDGKLDLIVANGGSSSVGVMLGNGNGTFGSQTTFGVGATPFFVTAADLNRDGKLDLVSANSAGGSISVLLGNGNGTFGAQTATSTGSQARSVVVADLNGDGKPDLAVANYGTGTVSILLGNGNGTFLSQQTFSAGAQAESVAVGDLNRDGKLDLAISNKSANTVSVLLGNGNGTFGTRATFTAGTLPFSVAIGDVNSDGKLDLVTANESGNSVGVLLGNGNGTFGGQTTFGAGTLPVSVVIGDVNGDGKLDIAAANYTSNNLSVLLGNGNGSFAAQKTFGAGTTPFGLASADVNRDGRLDLMVGNFGGGNAGVLVGDVPPYAVSINRSNPATQSTNASSVSYGVTFSEAVVGVDAADFALALNGVTASTPVVVSGSGAAYTVTVNGISGSGTLGLNLVDDGSIKDVAGNPLTGIPGVAFAAQQTLASGNGTYSITAADFSGDGKPDIAVPNSRNGDFASVLLGNGNGTFKARSTFGTGSNPKFVTSADVNRDGKLDLLVGAGASVSVLLGNGDGTFGTAQTVAAGASSAIAVADFNGDGIPDLAVANSSTIGVLIGNGNGTFQPQKTLLAGSTPSFVVASDFNGDGKADLAIANGFDHDVSVMLGNGNGTFQSQLTYAAGTYDTSVAAGDINGDGKIDLVVGNNYFAAAGSVSVLLGNGNGTFAPQTTFAAGSGPKSVLLSDLNNDGKLDVAVANSGNSEGVGSSISVLLGNGDGTLVAQQTFGTGAEPFSITASDLNGDGKADLATANFKDNDASTLLGSATPAGFTGQVYTIVPNTTVTPVVTGISRSNPTSPTTSASSLTFAVTFNEAVTGVDATDFRLATSGAAGAAMPVVVSGSGSSYTVTVNGVHGSGTLQLNLVDDDSIQAGVDNPLGGIGADNGSFSGPSYNILQTFPTVLSINRSTPLGPVTSGSSVSFAVTFSESVTGVDAADFALALSGVAASTPVTVSGGGATYTVTVSGVSGAGTLGLNLVDNGSIKDLDGNPLQGSMTTPFQPRQTFASFTGPRVVRVSDVNADGTPDLVIADGGSNSVAVMLGNGNGTFQAQRTFAAGPFDSGMAVGDLNGDGKPDVVVSNGASTSVSVLMGNGDGTLQPQTTLATSNNPRSIAIADVNGDGRPDLVISNGGTQASPGNTLGVMLGNGNGTFEGQLTFYAGGIPSPVLVADVNGDGKPDLITDAAVIASGTASVLLGNGNGTFLPRMTFDTGTGNSSIALADVNGDGNLDLIAPSNLSTEVGVLLGNGNGVFQARVTFGVGPNPTSVVAADVNGDGKIDLLVDSGGNHVSLLFGNGNGTFQAQQTFATGTNPYDIAVADVNGDARPDLLVVNGANPGAVGQLIGLGSSNVVGQTYTVIQSIDSITGTAGVDQIILTEDSDQVHIDWTIGSTGGQMLSNDVNGLTINGNGGNDVITLDYTNGNPLPNTLHLNGSFTINGLSGANPFSGTTLEIGQSTVYVNYASGPSPAAAIFAALQGGYNAGGWNGSGSGVSGAITSASAAGGPVGKFGIGFADSADGVVNGQPANTIEIRYTLMGDANLDGTVNGTDALALGRNYLVAGKTAWDLGNFNYDSTINLADAAFLQKNYNATVAPSVTPAMALTAAATTAAAGAGTNSNAANSTGSGLTPLTTISPTTDVSGTNGATAITPITDTTTQDPHHRHGKADTKRRKR